MKTCLDTFMDPKSDLEMGNCLNFALSTLHTAGRGGKDNNLRVITVTNVFLLGRIIMSFFVLVDIMYINAGAHMHPQSFIARQSPFLSPVISFCMKTQRAPKQRLSELR